MSDGGSEGTRRKLGKGDVDCISISWVAGITCVSSISGETTYLDSALQTEDLAGAHEISNMRRRGVGLTPVFDYIVAFPLSFMHRNG